VVDDPDGSVSFTPTGRLAPFEMRIPGDPSSAVFPIAAAVLAEGGELAVTDVGLNPTRTGFLRVLERMGVAAVRSDLREEYGEPVGTLRVAPPGRLRGTEVLPREVPELIDEIPMLAVLASRAEGETVFREVGELRHKESDRLELIATNLRAVGGRAEVVGDDLHVEGTWGTPRGPVRTDGDHRIAMAFAVLATLPGARVRVDDPACAAVSYPGFAEMLAAIRVRGER
jgi:3-phosphoshikimate 1-carboxyvinyltransferase